jgi:hypothetical protein
MSRSPVLTAVAAVLALAACGSSPGSAAHAGSPTPAETASPPVPTATAQTNGGGSGGGGTQRPHTATPAAHPSASPSLTGNGLPVITKFEAAPTCRTASGTATVNLTWTSQNATEAWISNPPVAVAAGDPRTTAGARGPLSPSGSTSMPFDCSQQYNYYELGVYAGSAQPSREVMQVARNV